MDDYRQVSCEFYAMCELAILRSETLRVAWRGARGQAHIEALRPIDLRTRRHAEFMVAYNCRGTRRVIRLDRVRSATPINTPAAEG